MVDVGVHDPQVVRYIMNDLGVFVNYLRSAGSPNCISIVFLAKDRCHGYWDMLGARRVANILLNTHIGEVILGDYLMHFGR